MKKAFKIILAVILAVVVAVLCIWQGELRTVAGIKQVSEDNPYLYVADYKASYDLDKVLDAGIDQNYKLVEFVIGRLSRGLYKPDLSKEKVGNGFACTSFQAKNAEGDGYLFGRNYDFFKNPTLVLKTSPKDAYASISTCDLSHLGYSLEKLPDSFAKKALCLAAVYAPMDGMNEKGLCVSIMALPKQPAWQDTGKPIAGTSILMRLMLDRCATVDEAVELVNSLDVRHDQNTGGGYHYLVSDAQGNCAAIEFDLFDGWKTLITRKDEDSNYMLMTNHLIAPKYYTTEPDPVLGNPHSRSWWRYAVADAFLGGRGGVLSSDEARQCLSDVHWKDLVWEDGTIENTQWSNVYDQSALTLRLCDWYEYDTVHEFSIAGAKSSWAPAGNNIRTRWAAEVGVDNARPEYPRPHMVRKQWQSLNGLWDYSICPVDSASMPQPDGEILVPFCPESSLSGVGRTVGGQNSIWYARSVEVPSSWEGKRVLLHFDAVDWKAETFVNGESAGVHTGGYTAFDYDITPLLEDGKADITLKVWDPTDDLEYRIPRGKQVSWPGGIWYTPVSGIWQSVWMEAVDESYVRDYNVTAALDGTVKVSVDFYGEADGFKVELFSPKVGYNPEKAAHPLFKKASGRACAGETAVLKLRNPRLWSPDEPVLYGLRIKLYKDGKVIDKVDGYTAIRTITEQRDEAGVKRMALNGSILYQFGPLDQGWWPDGLYTAPTAEAMAWDIEQTKALGFNMIRKHIKVEPARWYYDCDRLGMMVWQDMPCLCCYDNGEDWGQGNDVYGSGHDTRLTDEQKANYYKEWGEIIAQLRKFQSIVVWVPFNEAWGQFDTRAAVDFTRAADPTRLVNAASGGNWIEGAGDILDSHYYPNPTMRILDSEMINVLGEYGGIGRPVEGHTWDIGNKWGYVQFDTEQKVTDEYCKFADDLIRLKQQNSCAASVYTQTTDVEGEVNGFFTYDREVLKVDASRVREANQAVINAPNTL